MSEILPISTAAIFAAAFLAPTVIRLLGGRGGWVLSLAPFGVLVALLTLSGQVGEGAAVSHSLDWFGALNATFDLRLDGLALLMAILICGIGGFILIYASGYLHGHPLLGRFYLYLLAFMGAMLGLVLSDNLLILFIFWELTSITSYLLIGFNHEVKESRWKALQALLTTGLGAMGMLAGFILLANVTGTWKISEINDLGALVQESPFYAAIVILVLLGAFTKSAQFPFHFWLPNAMAGPTPVSAYLHSATMVKAGIFLMALLTPSLGGTDLWGGILSTAGSITLLLAVCLGLFQKDVKYVLAYTTLGVLGLLTLLLGIGTDYAIKAMVVFLLGHALYKATLFMVAGSIDHETGTRDATLLRGLRGLMPITAIAGGLAALSMSGLPPFFGFIGKELIYKAGVHLHGVELVLLGVAFVGNLLMMALALNVGVGPFFGKPDHSALPKKPHEAPLSMWIGPITLGTLGLLFGILPFLVTGVMVDPAIAAIQGTKMKTNDLALWTIVKPNLPLLISAFTILGGALVYLLRRKFWEIGEAVLAAARPYGSEAMYERIFNGTIWVSKVQTKALQSGRLHNYLVIIITATSILLVWSLRGLVPEMGAIRIGEFDWAIVGMILLISAATFVVAASNQYFTILGGLGVVGFGIALIYAFYGAPDLAITQLMAEALVVVLFMFVIYGLPQIRRFSGVYRRTYVRDSLLSCGFGILIAIMAWLSVEFQFDAPISNELAAMSYPEGKGKNVVNVILVDFRALDTFGEITVVAAAALGIAALLNSRARKPVESTEGAK